MIPGWLFMVFHGFSWFFMVFHGFSWFLMVFHVPGWFFMVFHGSRLVFHGFSWLQVGFSWFFSKMYPPKLYPGPMIQSRSAARRAAQDLVLKMWPRVAGSQTLEPSATEIGDTKGKVLQTDASE